VIQQVSRSERHEMETSDLVWWDLFVVAKGEGEERKMRGMPGEELGDWRPEEGIERRGL
jgi:hypothetical protein